MLWFIVWYIARGKTIDNIIPKNGPRIVYFPALIYGNMSFFPLSFILFFFCRNNVLLWYLPLWYWKFKQIVEWQKRPFGSCEYVVKSYRRWLMKFNSSQKITKIKKIICHRSLHLTNKLHGKSRHELLACFNLSSYLVHVIHTFDTFLNYLEIGQTRHNFSVNQKTSSFHLC